MARKNIAWHGFMTFVFSGLMFLQNDMIRFGTYILLIPSIAYFLGSVVQRQKMVIVTIRKKSVSQ